MGDGRQNVSGKTRQISSRASVTDGSELARKEVCGGRVSTAARRGAREESLRCTLQRNYNTVCAAARTAPIAKPKPHEET